MFRFRSSAFPSSSLLDPRRVSRISNDLGQRSRAIGKPNEKMKQHSFGTRSLSPNLSSYSYSTFRKQKKKKKKRNKKELPSSRYVKSFSIPCFLFFSSLFFPRLYFISIYRLRRFIATCISTTISKRDFGKLQFLSLLAWYNVVRYKVLPGSVSYRWA